MSDLSSSVFNLVYPFTAHQQGAIGSFERHIKSKESLCCSCDAAREVEIVTAFVNRVFSVPSSFRLSLVYCQETLLFQRVKAIGKFIEELTGSMPESFFHYWIHYSAEIVQVRVLYIHFVLGIVLGRRFWFTMLNSSLWHLPAGCRNDFWFGIKVKSSTKGIFNLSISLTRRRVQPIGSIYHHPRPLGSKFPRDEITTSDRFEA